MDNRAIGVFDSGLGGLTVVRELIHLLPHENIVYFGDTGRIPYGTRSRETVIKYAKQDIDFLLQHEVKCVIAACGTVSAVLPYEVSKSYGLLYTGVVNPAVKAALKATRNFNIGVIGTQTTIKSGAYEQAVHRLNEEAEITGKACPLLVSLVENGFVERDNEITVLAVKKYLQPFVEKEIDTLILGCTHFPLIKDTIADVIGEKVTLIDPGRETARYIAGELKHLSLLNESKTGGEYSFYVSDSVQMFCESAKLFLGQDITGKSAQITLNS